MDDYDISVLIAVGAIVGGIIILTIFFTLWGIVSKKISGDKLIVPKEINIPELKNMPVNVHFHSGSILKNVVLVGYFSTEYEEPYELKRLLILRGEGEKHYYVRITEIEFLEQLV